jgi:hypothetical protein
MMETGRSRPFRALGYTAAADPHPRSEELSMPRSVPFLLALALCGSPAWADARPQEPAAAPAAEAPPAVAAPAVAPAAQPAPSPYAPDGVLGLPLPAIAAALAAGETTSEALVAGYLARIEAIDRSGPTLRSVLAVNPAAREEARASDARRRAGEALGPLDGIPILLLLQPRPRRPACCPAASTYCRCA